MSTIREMRAKFTAEAQSLNRVFRDMQTGFRDVSRTSDRTSQDVNRNFQRMQSSMSEVESALQDVGNVEGFDDLNRAIRRSQDTLSETGQIGEEQMEEIRTAITRARSNFDDLGDAGRDNLRRLERSVSGLDAEIRDLGRDSGLDDLRSDVGDLNNQLSETAENAEDAADATARIGASANIGSIGSVFAALGEVKLSALATVGAIAAVGVGVVKLVQQGDELQKSFNTLETQTGATVEEMEGMESSLKNIYRNNFGESFDDIARSMANVHQATGLTDEALEGMTQTALLIRDTFGYEVEESVKSADTMMKNFGITADEAYTLIAQGAQEGADKGGELLDTINEYSPQFKAVGFDAEYMMDILVQGAKDGAFSIDKVGDAVKEMNIKMKDGNEDTGEALTSLGLNADDVRKRFAAGGEAGRKAFFEVTNALEKVEDPLKRNSYGVAIMGTQYEDLEAEGVSALSKLEGHVDKTGDTLQQLNEVKYNSVGESIQGIGRIITTDLLIPLQEKVMPGINRFVNNAKSGMEGVIQLFKGDAKGAMETFAAQFGEEKAQKIYNFFNNIKNGFNDAKQAVAPLKEAIKGIFALMQGNEGKGVSILTKLGLSASEVQNIINAINNIKKFVNTLLNVFQTVFNGIQTAVVKVWSFLKPYIMPIIRGIVDFVGEQLGKLTKFWEEDGKQITQAAKNAFGLIMKIVKFVMPAVLGIIKMVWGNIKGAISGALDFIMGLIKVFAGVFTGDFSKLWEGIKQMFKGAIQFVWNLINLLMIGRILKGIAGFIKAGVAAFKSFWTKTLDIFKNLDNSVGKVVSKLVGFLKNSWTKAKDEAVSIFTNIKNAIKGTFDDIISGAKALPGKIGRGIKNMAGKAVDGVIALTNRMLRGMGKGANGVIGGINWVLSKIGVDKKIPEWDVPQYAKGTGKKPHNGGLAIVGERGRELAWIPGVGPTMVGVKGEEMLNLPAGTSVLPNKETENLVGAGVIPGYANGVGDFLKSAGGKVVGAVKKGASGVGDFFVGLAEGAKKLISKVWDNFVDFPDMAGTAKDVAYGAIKKVRSSATDYLKDKLEGFNQDGGGFAGSGNVPGNVTSWITQALGITGKPMSWLGPLTTMAMKESGGRTGPSTINKWDSNWTRGTPSMGLMQTIMPTFNAYKVPGLNDVMNPVHNAAAAINYIVARYGNPFNTPGIRSMAQGGPYKGYARGGFVNGEQIARIGEGGKEEVVIPLQDHRERAIGLWKQAGEKLGLSNDSIAVLYNEQEKVVTQLKGMMERAKIQIDEVMKQTPILTQIDSTIKDAGAYVATEMQAAKEAINLNTDSENEATRQNVKQSIGANVGSAVKVISNAIQTMGVNIQKATTSAVKSVQASVSKSIASVTSSRSSSNSSSSSPKKTTTILDRVRSLIDRGGSSARKYFNAIKTDGDWLNDWVTNLGGKKTQKPYLLAGYEYAKYLGHSVGKYGAQHLETIKKYARGGMANYPQLAMLAEGGFSETIISHDPALKGRSYNLWRGTGDALGFTDKGSNSNNEVLKVLTKIERNTAAGTTVEIDGRIFVEVTKDKFAKAKKTDEYFSSRALGEGRG